MSANQARFPIAAMARVLGVSQARFYARRPRPPAARARVDEALLARIKTVHISSRQTYGGHRVSMPSCGLPESGTAASGLPG